MLRRKREKRRKIRVKFLQSSCSSKATMSDTLRLTGTSAVLKYNYKG